MVDHECVLTLDGSVLEDNLVREDTVPHGASVTLSVRWVADRDSTPELRVMNRERSRT